MAQSVDPISRFEDIAGKHVLITGASSGLGEHFAKLFAELGAVVYPAARRKERLEKLSDEIRTTGQEARPLALDVSDPGSVSRVLDELPIDIAINNAGTTVSASAFAHTPENIDQIIDTNVKGAFYVAQSVAKQLKARGASGSIINIASILGHRVAGHVSAYAASKAALIQLTRSLALEWARYGIRVNALCPGYIETELNRDFFASEPGQALIQRIPQRRLGQLSDLDAPVILLASEASRFMTGADIAIDGGHLISSL